jgi:hypothetical protein
VFNFGLSTFADLHLSVQHQALGNPNYFSFAASSSACWIFASVFFMSPARSRFHCSFSPARIFWSTGRSHELARNESMSCRQAPVDLSLDVVASVASAARSPGLHRSFGLRRQHVLLVFFLP